MVKLSEIRSANTSLKSSRSRLTAVVVGGTNGIGRGFLSALAAQSDSPKIYIVGRNPTTLSTIVSELQSLNRTGTYIPVPVADLTLLADVEKATAQIVEKEPKLDLLFMSQGYLSLGGRDESVEGLDKLTTIRHYGRTLFILNLLPLLNAAPSPRVVSVLGGGQEGPIFTDDLEFKDPKNYSLPKIAGASGTYVTLTLEQLQKRNPKISFVHAFPGLVKTNLINPEHWGPVARFLINWVLLPTIGRFFFISPEVSGERILYAASSPQFGAQGTGDDLAVGSNGVRGSGAYTLNEKPEAVHNDKALKPLREEKSDVLIWEHTLEILERVLGRKF
ncbi:uncharacterized protein JN550_008354 [Neoarthrinium moseri]|uniref:uncharacterized protein n=1 Tax=Neoarthrinium moseri TaxID=1658444 RepID=UPI001FDCECEB|nr:uncharacterized protein JN550_008354 [Neoarthrinium moseri]KAI1865306.1 hypothetical protein JN550_008354 [Neoarthrinium moseri]